jgi:hypothetical protein
MVGVGEVYEQFAAGELEDDDEVTIIHSDAATGFRSLSDAMVNVRATLRRAVSDGVLTHEEGAALVAMVKSRHYSERSFRRLLSDAPPAVAARLTPWLEDHRCDVKRADALTLLGHVRALVQNGALDVPHRPNFRFAHTDAWEQVRRQIRLKALKDVQLTETASGDAVLNELRIAQADFLDKSNHALVHTLAQELAAGSGEQVDQSLLADSVNAFRLQHGLIQPNAVQPWLEAQGLDVVAFTRLLKEALTTRRYRALYDSEVERTLIELLRLSGEYARLLARAERKQAVLSAQGLSNPTLEQAGITEEALWRWFASQQRCSAKSFLPHDVAAEVGYRDVAELRREALREWLFQKYL